MTVTKPIVGQYGWGPILNTALDALDARVVALEPNAFVAAPTAADSTGTPGQVAYDSSYFYVCVTTDTWVRTPLDTWS